MKTSRVVFAVMALSLALPLAVLTPASASTLYTANVVALGHNNIVVNDFPPPVQPCTPSSGQFTSVTIAFEGVRNNQAVAGTMSLSASFTSSDTAFWPGDFHCTTVLNDEGTFSASGTYSTLVPAGGGGSISCNADYLYLGASPWRWTCSLTGTLLGTVDGLCTPAGPAVSPQDFIVAGPCEFHAV